MTDWREAFDLDPGRVWLNNAHQGAIPRVAAAAAYEAVRWKLRPAELTSERFAEVPARVRRRVAALVGADPADVFLANGASHGLHLIAHGMPLAAGDEVLLMHGDFPSNILPWLERERDGVRVRRVRPRGEVLEVDEVAAELTDRTRAVCLSWVHSFSGWTLEVERIGELCRERGVAFVVNATQGIGTRPFDVATTPVDAIVCAGWKWLCGPYGVGFGWMRDGFRRSLRPLQRYWLAQLTAEDLGDEADPAALEPEDSARRFDLFSTANFFNFHAWGASLDLLAGFGTERIAAHDAALVERLLGGLPAGFEPCGARDPARRSCLVFLSHAERDRNAAVHRGLLDAGFDVAFRQGRIRVAPHLYNTPEEIDRLVGALANLAG